jgi:Nuclease-related domain
VVDPITGRRADQVNGQEAAGSSSSSTPRPVAGTGTSLEPHRPIWESPGRGGQDSTDSRLPERRWVSERAGLSEQPVETGTIQPAKPKSGTILPVRRTRISHLARDSRMPAWRRRLIIAVVVGVVFAVLVDWRVGLTAAVLAGIADAVIRSRSASASSAEGLTTSAQRRTKKELAKLERSGYRALHIRAIPGSEEVIDHLLIGPTGVYAIDSEQWDKRLPVRTKNARQLWHGPFSQRDRLEHARWEAAEASRFIGDALGEPVSVRPAMAVYGPAIPWGVATIRDVDVFGGDRLRKYLRKHSAGARAPRLSASEVERIYTAADRVLKPKR